MFLLSIEDWAPGVGSVALGVDATVVPLWS